jgi:voltage-gated potassium channel Kch
MIVSDPDRTQEIFREHDIPHSVCELMVVEFAEGPADLSGVLAALLMAEVNVHFSYPLLVRPRGRALLAIHLDDIECASSVLIGEGFKRLNQGRSFRQKIHALVYPSEFGGKLHLLFDNFIMVCVLISVSAVILESVQSISHVMHLEFIVLDIVMVAIFSLEYCTRLYCCVEQPGFQKAFSGRLRHAKSPALLVDLLAILPFFLEAFFNNLFDLRFLRVFRLMRLLKLTRYTGATATLTKVLAREWPVMSASIFIMLLLVVLTASLGYLFEHEAQPDKFENIPQSIYWAVVTLASVGYGDISPVTPVGRLMTIVMALVGIGIFAVPAAILSTAFNDQLHKDREMMHAELLRFMKDGSLSDEHYERIMREAEELHISQDEVLILINRVKQERAEMTQHQLPIAAIRETPEIAFEQFRIVVSNLRQIATAGDRKQMQELFDTPGRATDDELAIWRQIDRS